MASYQEVEMTDAEIDDFLGHRETGVLSLADGDEPYAIPISYGYDPSDRRFFLRLVSTPESEKRRFLDSTPRTRLVVYGEDGDVYWSVVSVGDLERIEPAELDADRIVQYGRAKRPLFEFWGESKRELDIQLYELTPDTTTGRRTEVDREG